MEQVTFTPSGIVTEFEHDWSRHEGVSPTGARYVGESVSSNNETTSVERSGNEVSVIRGATFHFIRTGESGETADDFFEHVVLVDHFNIDTGESTLHVEHVSSECR